MSKLISADNIKFTPPNGMAATDIQEGLAELNTNKAPANHNHDSTYQPKDADLTSIAELSGTSGYLKKTAADTWTLDTSVGSGTVTSITGGTGLTGGTITTSGTLAVSYGTSAGTACQGNDGRLSDARTPTSHTHGNITNAGAIGSTANLPIITTTSGALTTGSFGTSANTFCQGNDSRLSDARTPTSHTHAESEITNLTTDLAAKIAIPASSAQGDILIRDASGWTRLAAGTSGQYLKTQGASANPVWDNVVAGLQDSAHSFTTVGYQKLSNGFTIQWGSSYLTQDQSKTITFPIAFPNACYAVIPNTSISDNYWTNGVATSSISNTSFYLMLRGSAQDIKWIAVGA